MSSSAYGGAEPKHDHAFGTRVAKQRVVFGRHGGCGFARLDAARAARRGSEIVAQAAFVAQTRGPAYWRLGTILTQTRARAERRF